MNCFFKLFRSHFALSFQVSPDCSGKPARHFVSCFHTCLLNSLNVATARLVAKSGDADVMECRSFASNTHADPSVAVNFFASTCISFRSFRMTLCYYPATASQFLVPYSINTSAALGVTYTPN